MVNSNMIDLYTYINMKIFLIIQSFIPKRKAKENTALANPIVIFVSLLGVVMLAWAVGEAICWAHGHRHFDFVTKISEGYFKLGCK